MLIVYLLLLHRDTIQKLQLGGNTFIANDKVVVQLFIFRLREFYILANRSYVLNCKWIHSHIGNPHLGTTAFKINSKSLISDFETNSLSHLSVTTSLNIALFLLIVEHASV